MVNQTTADAFLTWFLVCYSPWRSCLTKTDEFLSTIDIEALVKQAENSTGGIPDQKVPLLADKDLKRFSVPMTEDTLKQVTNCSFSASTKCKAY